MAAQTRVVAANDKIGVGVIGCGGMGRNDLTDFQKQPEVEIRAVCDAFRPAAERARQMTGGRAEATRRFPPRRWIARISTPSSSPRPTTGTR